MDSIILHAWLSSNIPKRHHREIAGDGSASSPADLHLVLEVGEADLLDVRDAFGAEGRVVLLPVDLLEGAAGKGLEVVLGGIGRLDLDDERRERLDERRETSLFERLFAFPPSSPTLQCHQIKSNPQDEPKAYAQGERRNQHVSPATSSRGRTPAAVDSGFPVLRFTTLLHDLDPYEVKLFLDRDFQDAVFYGRLAASADYDGLVARGRNVIRH